jgi:hypothetical protein
MSLNIQTPYSHCTGDGSFEEVKITRKKRTKLITLKKAFDIGEKQGFVC